MELSLVFFPLPIKVIIATRGLIFFSSSLSCKVWMIQLPRIGMKDCTRCKASNRVHSTLLKTRYNSMENYGTATACASWRPIPYEKILAKRWKWQNFHCLQQDWMLSLTVSSIFFISDQFPRFVFFTLLDFRYRFTLPFYL